jgi:hypothetical protein
MCAMALTRASRSLVALVTAILLLLCQTAFAAQACAHAAVPAPAQSPAAAPCHDMSGGSTTPTKQLPTATACEAAKALPDVAKVPVFALHDLPSVLVAYEPFAAQARLGVHAEAAQAVCYSPPLSILHCRFLN